MPFATSYLRASRSTAAGSTYYIGPASASLSPGSEKRWNVGSNKVPLGELEAERLALKERFAGSMRWEHHQGGHYILVDVIRLCPSFSGAPGLWGVLYVQAGDTSPVPFARELEDFLDKFKPVGGSHA
jgi:hypothetical protein